ncbi:MAG TPA: hypothetical protein VNC41_17280 [Acidimicrobiia bacterium]|nr:hypothetical protein [Acidimicrobiia bacterium]
MSAPVYALITAVVAILDELDVPYALGGSIASSIVGQPRSTDDGDIAIHVDRDRADILIARLAKQFYVPASAAIAVDDHSSFNVLDVATGSKVDLFVVGDGLLDRMQIERRVQRSPAGLPADIWITSIEDLVLRKLDWYRSGGGVSQRQWRDVCAVLHMQSDVIDRDYLTKTADLVELGDLLEQALREAGGTGSS